MSRFGVFGLLRGGRDRVEADIGKEHHGRAAEHAGPAEYAGAGVGRDESARRDCAAVTQFAVVNAGAAQTMNRKITISLMATMKLLNRADSRMPITSSAVIAPR